MFLPGEKELASELLSLVKTAREQEATIPQQGKILHQMGELYLKDAIETGNEEQFVKASALINAALVRTEDPSDQKELLDLLCNVYKGIMNHIKGASFEYSLEALSIKTNTNKDSLHGIRLEVDKICGNIKQLFNSYSRCDKTDPKHKGDAIIELDNSIDQMFMDSEMWKMLKEELEDKLESQIEEDSDDSEEDIKWKVKQLMLSIVEDSLDREYDQYLDSKMSYDLGGVRIEMEEKLVREVKKVSLSVQTHMIEFVKRLWTQALDMCSVLPPCRYAVIGLGSLARQEITPYSDLEFALLVETESEEIKKYFRALVYLFHLHILDLGETPIPAVAIESLNDYLSPDGDRYFDRITPRGFRLDGAMPWACKTPIGRKGTPQKEPLDLIKTPEEMAALLREDNVLGQAYRVADILCNSILICGEATLFDKFTKLSTTILSKNTHKENARKSIVQDFRRSPDLTLIDYGAYNLKNKEFFYRFPSSFVENLRMFFTPSYQPNSVWKTLDHLLKVDILSVEGTFNLKVQLAFCYTFRLLSYFKNKGQYENFGFLRTKDTYICKQRPKNPLKDRTGNYVAYFSNDEPLKRLYETNGGLIHVVKKYFLDECQLNFVNLKAENFIQFDDLQHNGYSWFRTGPLLANLKWARTANELPPKSCGPTCFVRSLIAFSYMYDYSILKVIIDDMIAHKDCKCLSLLRTSFCVTKAVLIQKYDLVGEVPTEANIPKLQEFYRQKGYRNIRERFYLLLDISDLAILSTDIKTKLTVIDDIEKFFIDMAFFEEFEKTMVQVLEFYLVENLINLCNDVGKTHTGVLLCQKMINEYENELGPSNLSARLGKWYFIMGNLLDKCGNPVEACNYFQKQFDSSLQLFRNSSYNNCNDPAMVEEMSGIIRLPGIRRLGLRIAFMHKDNHRLEDAIEVLTLALTKDDKIYHIDTDTDVKALVLLFICCNHFVKYASRANSYFEEILEFVIKKGSRHSIRPDIVYEIVACTFGMVAAVGLPGGESSYIIKNIYKKYCNDTNSPTKVDYLIGILNKLLNDKSLFRYFLDRQHKKCDVASPQYHPEMCQWPDFFFWLGSISMWFGSTEEYCLLSVFKVGDAMLDQAQIFCENVIKNLVPENICNMCELLICFYRVRIYIFDSVCKQDKNQFQSVLEMAETVHCELLRSFPNCFQAHKATDKKKLRAMWKGWI